MHKDETICVYRDKVAWNSVHIWCGGIFIESIWFFSRGCNVSWDSFSVLCIATARILRITGLVPSIFRFIV